MGGEYKRPRPASGTATALMCLPARSLGALAVLAGGAAAARRPGLERTGELDQAQELAAIAEAVFAARPGSEPFDLLGAEAAEILATAQVLAEAV